VKTGKFLLALVAVALVAAAPGAAAPAQGGSQWGERVALNQVLIPFYDWDTGKAIIGSTPANCQYVNTCAPEVAKHIPKQQVQPFYLVVYPISEKGKIPVQCVHDPADNCPDHGPLIAAGAKKLVPSVYGNGVWGHNHLGAGPESPEYRVIASPVLVIFKTRKAATKLITTRKEVMQLVKTHQAFLYAAPQYMFINYVVPAHLYAEGKPVTPKPMKMP
jgi:hypothetical protein